MFTIVPVGTVSNERFTPEDDYWGDVISEITLEEDFDESSFDGIDSFSYLEIFYIFDLVNDEKIQFAARHPRNNPSYPKVGIFAQRGKNRPNKIGATIVELLKREGKTIWVLGLDAINGTPVIDIKPVMQEFLPLKEVRQPKWSTEIMKHYWK